MLEFTTVRARIQELADDLYGAATEGDANVQLGDLDSFGVVQLLLAVERDFDLTLLEELHAFKGDDFDDFARFVVEVGSISAASQ